MGAALAVVAGLTLPLTLAGGSAHAAGFNSSDVSANLFGWNWNSVAAECTGVLGPGGYGAVEVSPPEESYDDSADGHPWWDVYQPISYRIDSRFGTEAQFKAMTSACHSAGVKVYADAVINHMTAQTSATGYAGTSTSSKYSYGSLYSTSDFHYYPADCSNSDDDIASGDYTGSASNVQNCQLLGLADLATGRSDVRGAIAGYLNSLEADGVDGFRVDAAKHIPDADLAAIEGLLNKTAAGESPYVFQEVQWGSGEAVQPSQYYSTGKVLDFQYPIFLKQAFDGSNGGLANLQTLGSTWTGVNPSADAVTFVTNHDTERNGQTLNYKDTTGYPLATDFLLGFDYGSPQVFSGFTWSSTDQSPPADGSGFVTDTDCSSSAWYCLDRQTATLGMVAFHNAVAGTGVSDWQSDGQNIIGFSRGSTGFLALNNTASATAYTFTTGLAAGDYCDLVSGGGSAAGSSGCKGTEVTVDSGGKASITVPAYGAVAIDTAQTTAAGSSATPVTFDEYASTTPGTSVYLVGSDSRLGGWNTADAIKLSSAGYPVWSGTVDLPQSSAVQYKYLEEDSSGNVTWESNANRSLTTATAPQTVDNSWDLADADATDVTFHVTEPTTEQVYVSGSIPELGAWNTADAIPLDSAGSGGWSRLAIVPKSTSFQYKYLLKDSSGNVTWEGGGNRSYTTGSSAGYTTSDSWQG
ncbi:carbohydrate-binding module family 20 domain-containing protein [Phaeacidiphilus oryzae]|uniref:carbohydrate-binding module family 20 domain-containing protein n=1 Tax=Phaeacidiphilus oryzae TaxID=348818 RepID=UPI001F22593C|nr:carbohydrate-binding module family 20 domain-containing protein [Phaeacidiphilus oryzae]